MLSHVSVINFRNYKQCRIAFQSGINVLYGENGAGKTNLLEALSLLSPGRGLRHATINDFVPFSYLESKDSATMSGWGITARIEEEKGFHTISTGMTGENLDRFLNGEAVKRHIRIDNIDYSSQEPLTEYLSVLWLTPAMDGILAGAASEKRRFFDRIIFSFDPAHSGRLARYDKALRSRNQLLKEPTVDISWIRSFHDTLAKTGVAIAESRNHIVNQLNNVLEKLDTPFPKAIIASTGYIENLLHNKTALEVEQIYREALENSITTDIQRQNTEIGVHKSDYSIIHCLKNTNASFCSTGEQKALLISIILGYAELLKNHHKGTSLLLLDEMAAHLDNNRRKALFDYLLQSNMQVFATGTEKKLFDDISSKALFLQTNGGFICP